MKKPKVSILCITYNQKEFVRQTLEGFMMQKTDFDFEVLINDDASTDGTAEIIAEFQQKYPDIVKPIFQPENQYSKGFRGMFTKILFPIAQGKYLALCEGDDYWTDPQKLQIQADFMDKHPSYSVCFHKVHIVYDNHEQSDQIYPDVDDEAWYTTEQLLRANFIQTNSVMYRKQDYENIADDVMPGDWYMHLFHARFGKIKMIDRVMSVYRKHKGGIWWEYDHDRDKIWMTHGLSYIGLFDEVLRLYKDVPEQAKIVQHELFSAMETMAQVDDTHGTDILKQVLSKYPEYAEPLLLDLHQRLRSAEGEKSTLTTNLLAVGDERHELQLQLAQLEKDKQALEQRLNKVLGTRTWRARQKLVGVRRKIAARKPGRT